MARGSWCQDTDSKALLARFPQQVCARLTPPRHPCSELGERLDGFLWLFNLTEPGNRLPTPRDDHIFPRFDLSEQVAEGALASASVTVDIALSCVRSLSQSIVPQTALFE